MGRYGRPSRMMTAEPSPCGRTIGHRASSKRSAKSGMSSGHRCEWTSTRGGATSVIGPSQDHADATVRAELLEGQHRLPPADLEPGPTATDELQREVDRIGVEALTSRPVQQHVGLDLDPILAQL